MVGLTIDLKNLPGYMDTVAKEQLPFACASTLTHVAMKIAEDIAGLSSQRFHTLSSFARGSTTARLGQQPSKKYAYHAVPALKKDGLDRMQAVVGVSHWGLAEQVGVSPVERQTRTAKYRWVPLKGRKLGYGVRNAYPSDGNKSKGNFFMKSKRGNTLLVTRAGRSRKITPIFLRRKSQTIQPRINMPQLTRQRFKRYFDYYFERDMDRALKTAR